MSQITLNRLKVIPQRYIKAMGIYHFNSLTELIILLFSTYKKGTDDWEEIKALLNNFGFSNLNQVHENEIPYVHEWLRTQAKEVELSNDVEYATYKLLAKIVANEILVYINDDIVSDITKSIEVTDFSIISFIDKNRIKEISFTTI